MSVVEVLYGPQYHLVGTIWSVLTENVPTFGTSLKHDLQPRFKGLNPTFLNLFVIQEPILFFLCFPSVLLYGALDEPLLFSYPLSLWLLSLCRGFVLLAWDNC